MVDVVCDTAAQGSCLAERMAEATVLLDDENIGRATCHWDNRLFVNELRQVLLLYGCQRKQSPFMTLP